MNAFSPHPASLHPYLQSRGPAGPQKPPGVVDGQTDARTVDRHQGGAALAVPSSPSTMGSAPTAPLQPPPRASQGCATPGMVRVRDATTCGAPVGRETPPAPASPLLRGRHTILILLLLCQRLADGLQLAQVGATLQVPCSWGHRGPQQAEPRPPVSPPVPVPIPRIPRGRLLRRMEARTRSEPRWCR